MQRILIALAWTILERASRCRDGDPILWLEDNSPPYLKIIGVHPFHGNTQPTQIAEVRHAVNQLLKVGYPEAIDDNREGLRITFPGHQALNERAIPT